MAAPRRPRSRLLETLVVACVGVAVLGGDMDCGSPEMNAADQPENASAEQRYYFYSTAESNTFQSRDVDYWCKQNLGKELSPMGLYTPSETKSTQGPDYETATCDKFYLNDDPNPCGLLSDDQLREYAYDMRELSGVTDSTARCMFVVGPTQEAAGEVVWGTTFWVNPLAGPITVDDMQHTGAFVFRDRIESWARWVCLYDPETEEDAYTNAVIRLTSLAFIHEFGHLTFGVGHAHYNPADLNHPDNLQHTLEGPKGKCVLDDALECTDADMPPFPLHFCDDWGSANSCRRTIRNRYGLTFKE